MEELADKHIKEAIGLIQTSDDALFYLEKVIKFIGLTIESKLATEQELIKAKVDRISKLNK